MNRTGVVGALAALVVGAATVGGWLTWSERVADDVHVTWADNSPVCEGATVDNGDGRPVIEAVESMRCVVTVGVANDSSRAVHLGDALASSVGPETGTVVTAEGSVEADDLDGASTTLDAVVPLDRTLNAGDATNFDIVLVFNPEGCNDSGTFTSENWPVVTVDTFGRSHTVASDKDFSFSSDGATPGCANQA